MTVLRASLLAIVAVTVSAQINELSNRLQHALAASGEGDLAAQKLAARDFLSVEQMLEKRKLLEVQPSAEIVSLQGAVAFVAGDTKAAVAHFGKAAELGPLPDTDSFTFAMALVTLGDDQRATRVLETLAQKHPGQSIYVYWLGRIDYDLRRYGEAVEKLQEAVTLDPQSARAWDSLGLAFDMQGQTDEAYRAFTKAADANRRLPRPSPWPPNNLGSLCLRTNRLQEAENSLRESLRYDPKLAQAHYYLARVIEKEGIHEEAVGEYRTAISLDSSSTDACYSLAMLYRKLHKEGEAAAMFAEYNRRKHVQTPN